MPDLAVVLPLIAVLAAIGAIAGVLAGLLGVGGGILLVPAFLYVFTTLGYGGPQVMQVCLATSLSTIVATSVRSVLSHHKRGAVDWPVLLGWAPFIGAGALGGVVVASFLKSTTLQAIFGILGVCTGLFMAFGRAAWQLGPALPTGIQRGLIGVVIGLLSVLMGIGGGSFAVPLMTMYGLPIHRAVATAAGFGATIAVPSVVAFCFVSVANPPPGTLGAVNLPAFLLVIPMTMLTAPLGVRLAHALNPKPLKWVFALFITVIALNMLRNVLGW
jgi:uncharacterized membrane protein YfcA